MIQYIHKNARLLIRNYTDYFSGMINGYLRKHSNIGKGRNDYFEYYRYLLNKSLMECNYFNNKTVIRMDRPCSNPKYALMWYKKRIGHSVCFPGFLSTTKCLYGESELYLYIKTNSNSAGKNIEPYLPERKARLEQEVLFMNRSIFEIESVNISKSIIYLKEENRNPNAGIVIYDNTFYKDPDISRMLELDNDDRELSLSEQGLI